MKNLLPFVLLFCCFTGKTQNITARVIDATNSKPLSFAIVVYSQQQKIMYTDYNGYFTIAADSIPAADSIFIQYLGFKKFSIALKDMANGLLIKLLPDVQALDPVIVSNCRKTETFTLNKNIGRIRQYIGPGPETKLVIMSRYSNNSGRTGYITHVNILIDEKAPNMQVPIRLRWYEWNNDTQMPGKELTDTNLLVYPRTKGWNDFEIPSKTIKCAKDYLVFGLEFIYTPDFQRQFNALQTNTEKLQWLNDMENRWSLSMQYVKDENETGFYMLNNGRVLRYQKKYDKYFIRPAIKFTIEVCKE
ncbi:peptidase associated/transthyretin-like domain-containing protein [Limnovirga soli]|uniref:Carboxypeptidase-like regulatory domain-containing protein n=1 Tax=Limnovirga soli TaxID=2656915 RepID=A0A8J8FHX7_9BACT|nr:hypothetical protein [Limnovirga soli]NNV55389.1 hypothetical protein [Limnovirga soli]